MTCHEPNCDMELVSYTEMLFGFCMEHQHQKCSSCKNIRWVDELIYSQCRQCYTKEMAHGKAD